jgi:hypothetical protein
MDPMGGQPAYAPAGHQQAPTDGSGVCGTCGRQMPPLDLETVAAGIDQTLSIESGKMVARTAWAGRAPDGMMDSLLSFMPSVKAKRQLWERGQALWTERMTQAISGPCEVCQSMAGSAQGGPAMGQPYPPASGPYVAGADQPATAYQQTYQPQGPSASEQPPYAGATSVMPGYGTNDAQPPADEVGARTSMMEPYATPEVTSDEDDSAGATTALPAFLSHTDNSLTSPPQSMTPPAAPPAPDLPPFISDEHESHTVMLSVPANLRAGPRLIVLEGPVHGRQFTLGRQLTTIGRSIGCHVTIESDAVGYDHARVVRTDDGWRLEPLESAGDTFVNDDEVRDPRPLKSGDVIRIGPARMRFESVG